MSLLSGSNEVKHAYFKKITHIFEPENAQDKGRLQLLYTFVLFNTKKSRMKKTIEVMQKQTICTAPHWL